MLYETLGVFGLWVSYVSLKLKEFAYGRTHYSCPRMNANEMIKNLSLHGIDCVNIRICDREALARIALMRSGVVIEQEFINRSDEIAVVAEAVKNIDYFRQSSYKDLTNISAAINRMRTLVTGSNEIKVIEETMSRGLFKEKNDALVMACKNYISIMNSKGCIDCISLIRKVFSNSSGAVIQLN